ncbi:MAG: SHOCT domain-containing protein [Desulfomonilia bacterium]|nr:SHOCT domain-containing protein [Desulfomonilia bacterium]
MVALCCLAMLGCAQTRIPLESEDESISHIKNHREALAPDLQFLGKVRGAEKAAWSSRLRGATLQSESLVYGSVSDNQVVERGIIVRTYKILGESDELLHDLFTDNTHVIDSGSMEVAGKDFSYDLLAKQDVLARNERNLMGSRGLIIKDCYLVKEFRSNMRGFFDKSKSHILYFEATHLDQTGSECVHLFKDVPTEQYSAALLTFTQEADRYLTMLLGGKPAVESAADKQTTMDSDQGEPGSRRTEIERKLTTLKNLLDKGLITEGDYEKKKAELLEEF